MHGIAVSVSWTLGMIISIVIFAIGKWKKKMMERA